jgi:hypothetical protein
MIALATIKAKTARNVCLLTQTILPSTLNDMQSSLLVGLWAAAKQAFGKCEIARWFQDSFCSRDQTGCIAMLKKQA